MSPMTGGEAPRETSTWEGPAARKSQRGAFVIAGGLITTSVALAVLAAVIIFVSLAHSASARHLAAKRLQLAEKRYQLTESQLRPGDCLTGSDLNLENDSAWPAMFTKISCTQPHLGEVFYVGHPWPESLATYPGDSTVFKIADDRCSAAFTAYDGVAETASRLGSDIEVPTTVSDWATGDREVVCVAYDPGPPLSHSIKGTRQ
jgi:hypothetical protein